MQDLQSRLTDSNGFLIAYVGTESHRRFADVISKRNIGMYQQAVLTTLAFMDEQTTPSQKELGSATGIDPRNLVPVIDSLEERSLIERQAIPHDRRRFAIKLTTAGRTLALEMLTAGQKLEDDMFACLNEQEKATLHQLLLKLYQAIEGLKEQEGAHRESKK